METLFLIKYGEIALKGDNRAFFMAKLRSNIKHQLRSIPYKIITKWGRLYLNVKNEDAEIAGQVLSRVYGITGFAFAVRVKKDMEEIRKAVIKTAYKLINTANGINNINSKRKSSTTNSQEQVFQEQVHGPFKKGLKFKIEARRTDKSFSPNSYGIACDLGAALLKQIPDIKVDLTHPDWIINVEIRELAYIYGPEVKGIGGLPVGCSGKGILLLSGGIDSPVAGYLMAKRGLNIDSIYFHTHPYTSEKVLEKVKALMGILSSYIPACSLYIVPFTDIQIKIKEHARPEELTLLSRACMMSIASHIAKKVNALCLITGESLGQVASQTLKSLAFTGSHSPLSLTTFRPLIGMDKDEIIKIARRTGTYETSILPYPDCCTLFAPDHPLTNPDFKRIWESFRKLDLESLIEDTAGRFEKLIF